MTNTPAAIESYRVALGKSYDRLILYSVLTGVPSSYQHERLPAVVRFGASIHTARTTNICTVLLPKSFLPKVRGPIEPNFLWTNRSDLCRPSEYVLWDGLGECYEQILGYVFYSSSSFILTMSPDTKTLSSATTTLLHSRLEAKNTASELPYTSEYRHVTSICRT